MGSRRMIQDGQDKSGRGFCRCRCSGTGDDCGRVRDKNKSKGQSKKQISPLRRARDCTTLVEMTLQMGAENSAGV